MPYRKIDTRIWCDPWFEGLSSKAKLGFIYLWTNEHCNAAGLYELSPRRILFELGYGIDTISDEISPKILWLPAESLVWVKNFFAHQCQNPKFAHAALKVLGGNKLKLKMFIEHNLQVLKRYEVDISGYCIDMVSIPSGNGSDTFRAINRTEQRSKEASQERGFKGISHSNLHPLGGAAA